MTMSQTSSVRTDRDDAAAGFFLEQDLRITRLEREYNGPYRDVSVVAVPTLGDRPANPQPGLYVYVVSSNQWYQAQPGGGYVVGAPTPEESGDSGGTTPEDLAEHIADPTPHLDALSTTDFVALLESGLD